LQVQQLEPLHIMLMEYRNSSIQMKWYCVPLNVFEIPLCLIKFWTSYIGLTIFVKGILLCGTLYIGIDYHLHGCLLLYDHAEIANVLAKNVQAIIRSNVRIKDTNIERFSSHKIVFTRNET
jgi:hypothetical protein